MTERTPTSEPLAGTEPVTKKSRRSWLVRALKALGWLGMWTIVWPAIFIILAIIVAGSIYALMGGDGDFVGASLRFYILSITAVLAFVGVILITLLTRKKADWRSVGVGVLSGYLVLGVVIGVIMGASIPDGSPEAAVGEGVDVQRAGFVLPELEHDPQIIARLGELGISDEEFVQKSSQQYVDSFEGEDAILNDQFGLFRTYVTQLDGKFAYGELKIKSGLDIDTERTAIAHEYLHYVWSAKIANDQVKENQLTSQLMTLYGRDPWMQQRVAEYSNRNTLIPTELFSYYCTESSDSYLSPAVLAECNTHLNRAALVKSR